MYQGKYVFYCHKGQMIDSLAQRYYFFFEKELFKGII